MTYRLMFNSIDDFNQFGFTTQNKKLDLTLNTNVTRVGPKKISYSKSILKT